MTPTDDLVARLTKAANDKSLAIGDAWNLLQEAAEALESRSPAEGYKVVPQWIPVGERLPEARYGEENNPTVSDDVLVLFGGGDSIYDIANYDHETLDWWLVTRPGHQTPDAPPTHWMPLPAAPDKESAK